MKKLCAFLFSLVWIISACTDETTDNYQTVAVTVQLIYPATSNYDATEGISVQARSTSGVSYKKETNQEGKVTFTLPVGIYELSATDKRSGNGKTILLSGSQANIAVQPTTQGVLPLNMVESTISQVIIKELYHGGCQKNDGSGAFSYDKYVVLYNNSEEEVDLQHLCLAITIPYNSNIANSDIQNGVLSYESEGWIPAGLGYFYFQHTTTLTPGEQVVVAFNNANDNTLTYSNSVDLSRPEYYIAYAPELFNNTLYHPAPNAAIPTSHYLPGVKYGTGNAWALSNTCPAFFLFYPENDSPESFAADASNNSLYGGSASQVRKKVPVEWVLDGIEVFRQGASNNVKRFTSTVDAGFIELTAGYGYSLYRNVDKEATEALAQNAGKLVYHYALGTTDQNGTTDPSGIDAEASIKLGARIIYQDTNNSSQDFHQRSRASIKE